MRSLLLATAIALSLIAATPLKFAAVSIHRQAPDDNSFFVKPPANGKFIATGVTARLMVMLAWDLQDSQIAGGPAWFATDHFSIEANSDDGQLHRPAETCEILQNMLADRFALRTHHEMREGSAALERYAAESRTTPAAPAASNAIANVDGSGAPLFPVVIGPFV